MIPIVRPQFIFHYILQLPHSKLHTVEESSLYSWHTVWRAEISCRSLQALFTLHRFKSQCVIWQQSCFHAGPLLLNKILYVCKQKAPFKCLPLSCWSTQYQVRASDKICLHVWSTYVSKCTLCDSSAHVQYHSSKKFWFQCLNHLH